MPRVRSNTIQSAHHCLGQTWACWQGRDQESIAAYGFEFGLWHRLYLKDRIGVIEGLSDIDYLCEFWSLTDLRWRLHGFLTRLCCVPFILPNLKRITHSKMT